MSAVVTSAALETSWGQYGKHILLLLINVTTKYATSMLSFLNQNHTPLHYAALSPAQTVGKLSVTSWRKEGCRMSEISPRRRQCLIMTLWMIHGVPVIDHGPKIEWVTFSRFSLFQNPAAMSLEVDEHFRSLTNMLKVDFLKIWTISKCTDYLSMKVIVLK